MQLKTSRKSNRERPGPLLPSGLLTAARTVIPFPELCRFPQTMTSPGAGCGWQRRDFPRRAAAGRAEQRLSGAGGGADKRRPRGPGQPVGRGRVEEGGGGLGAARGGAHSSSNLYWPLAGGRHSGWRSPPALWNWSRGGAENADLASSTDIH